MIEHSIGRMRDVAERVKTLDETAILPVELKKGKKKFKIFSTK